MTENETVTEEVTPQDQSESTNVEEKEVKEEVQEVTEPQTRGKKPIDYIMQRKDNKIQKLQAQLEARSSQDDAESETTNNEASNYDFDAIDSVIQERYGDYFKDIDKSKNDSEVNSYLDSDEGKQLRAIPGFEEKFKQYSSHASRANMPLSAVALEVAGLDNILKIGASLGQQADERAAETSLPGNSHRPAIGTTKLNPNPSIEDVIEMKRRMGI